MTNPEDILSYKKYARKDFGLWFALCVCGIISFTVFYLEPSEHCPEKTDCLPLWLIYSLGTATLIMTCAILLAFLMNKSQGSYFDQSASKFIWWQYTTKKGKEKTINISDIKEIYVSDDSESTDARIYDVNDNLLSMCNANVIPYPQYEEWAEAIKQKWPHIKIEIN